MTAEAFLRALFTDEPGALIQVVQRQRHGARSTWRTYYCQAPGGAAGYARRDDVYVAVGLAGRDHGRSSRAGAAQVVGVPGLWLDIDVDGGPENREGGVPTKAAAVELAHAVVEPTILVDSGYGIHAWYLLDAPWLFATIAERDRAALLSARWYAAHGAAAAERGWRLDQGTKDLARILRVPGSRNLKGATPVPVTVLADGGPRYGVDRLDSLVAGVGPVGVPGGGVGGYPGYPEVKVAARGVPDEIIAIAQAMCDNDPEFAATWHHHRARPGWSLSEFDMAVASLAAHAGALSDQQLADLIACHRLHHAPGDRKALRTDYLARTVAKARAPRDARSAA